MVQSIPDSALTVSLRALLLEHSLKDAKLMAAAIERSGCRLTIDRLDSLPAFEERLNDTEYDIIISDYNLPGFTAMDALSHLQKSGKDIPFLVVSGNLGDEAAAECIKRGATDYILKDRMASLPAAVTRALQERSERIALGKAQEALAASEKKYRLLFESNPHAMWVFDRHSLRFLEVNEAAVRRYGYWRSAFLAMTVKDIYPDEDVPEFLNQLSRSPDLMVGLWKHRTRLGELIDVEVTSHGIQFDGREAMLAIASDVTARMRADARLRSSEAKFRQAFNASPEPITISTVEEGRYLDVNNSFLEITQHVRKDVIGRTGVEVGFWLKPEDRRRVLTAMTELGRAHDMEVKFGTKSGQVRTGLISAEPVTWDGEPCLLCVVKDITERKSLEHQFRQAQKMEAVGQLAGGVAHDFNNLLMVINGYSEVILDKLAPSDPLHEPMGEIKKAGDRASGLTRQLLAFSRQQVLAPQIVNLNTVVEGMGTMLKRLISEHLEFAVILGPNLGGVRVDASQIEHVILNLVVNARDAMPDGGRLTIETQNVELDESFTRNHVQAKPGPHVLLAVSDTGVGMDADAQQHIFEPFFTTKERGKGTGLGLSTVYGIVQQSEGSIWVYSEPGQGTSFKIYLPRIDKVAADPVPSRKAIASTGGGHTVLLVEDELSVRLLVRVMLESLDYRVLEARDGTEGLRIAEQHAGPIHVLVTDVVMPGANGQVLAERLAVSRPGTKVLYMSGYTDDVVFQRGLLNANVAFLQKPFTSQVLAQKLAELIKLT